MSIRAINTTWLALMLLTSASYYFAEFDGATPWLLPLFALAAIKLGLIQTVFMELFGCRPLILRIALAFDVFLICLIALPFYC